MTIWCLSFQREFSSWWIQWCQWICKHQSVIIELNCHHCWCLHFQREFNASNDDNLMFTFSKRIDFDHLFCRPSTCRTVASLACFSFHHQKLSFQQIIIKKIQIRIIRNCHIIIEMVIMIQNCLSSYFHFILKRLKVFRYLMSSKWFCSWKVCSRF